MSSIVVTCTITCSIYMPVRQLVGVAGCPAADCIPMAFTYWHPMQVLFGTVAIDVHAWQMIVAVASTVFILVEIESFLSACLCPKRGRNSRR